MPKVFESLCKQTFCDFEWILVDDGSSDNTEDVVRDFDAAKVNLRYVKKTNGGKHTAINLGVKLAKGELIVPLDSDDSLPVDSLQTIAEEYAKVRGREEIGGVCGLMAHHGGRQIGSGFGRQTLETSEVELRHKHHVEGDLLEVFRTSVMMEFPFPEIVGEKFCPEQLAWFRIAQKYRLHCFNKVVYFRDYLDGGLTERIVRIRMNSPIASCMTYAEMLDYDIPFMQKVKAAINYWRFFCCSNNKEGMPRISKKWLALALVGVAMHLKDRRKNKC